MAQLFGLDIPFGLENLFSAVLQLKPNGDVNGVGLTLPKQNAIKSKRTRDRSLMVLWGPMYDAFTTDRKNAWQSYWGGWPGSGFSAFIEVNAPLYKAGEDLILDPPGFGDELFTNGTLDTDASGWDLNVAGNSLWQYGGNDNFVLVGIDGGAMKTACEIEDGQIYEVHIAGIFTPHNFGKVTVQLGNGPTQDLNFADSQIATILLIAGVASDLDKFLYIYTDSTFTGGILSADTEGFGLWSIQKYDGMEGDGTELYTGSWEVKSADWEPAGSTIITSAYLNTPDTTIKSIAQDGLTLTPGGHYKLSFFTYGIPGKYDTLLQVWCGAPTESASLIYKNRLNGSKAHRVDFVAPSDFLLIGWKGKTDEPGIMIIGNLSLKRTL